MKKCLEAKIEAYRGICEVDHSEGRIKIDRSVPWILSGLTSDYFLVTDLLYLLYKNFQLG
jgi:hypothetical protein